MRCIEVINGGYISTVQDLGRIGWGRYGVPRGGAMDEFAFRVANRLVGNEDNAAAVEVGAGGFEFRVNRDAIIAVCGRGFTISVDDQPVPLWQSQRVYKNQQVRVVHGEGGMWGIVAVNGGIAVKEIMGSRSTALVGKFGGWEGRLLQAGDCLPLGPSRVLPDWSRTIQSLEDIYEPARPVPIRVVKGPHANHFPEEAYQQFLQQTFTLSSVSNRTGYRLEGEPLSTNTSADMVSFGMLPGAIQLPPSRLPIVMMADTPPTGGYPVIAVVIRADLPRLAQCEPDITPIRFEEVNPEQARLVFERMMKKLDQILVLNNSAEFWNWAGAIK